MAKRVVYKHILNLGKTAIHFPPDSKIMSIQAQRGQICMWVEHDPAKLENPEALVRLEFQTVPTGAVFEGEGMAFQATVQDGDLVWHVYRRS